MRALRSCDFCDAAAVGTFEVVPPELEPTDAEQRRVVLCDDCSRRLETLLEPLLDRLGADGTGGNGADAAEAGSAVAITDDSTSTRTRPSGSNATVSDAADDDSGATDRPTADPTDADGPGAGRDDGRSIEGITVQHDASTGGTDRERDSGGSRTEPSASGSDAAAAEPRTDETSADTTTADTEAGDPAATDTTDADRDGDETSADRDGDADETATAMAAAQDRTPKAYAKVVRLLRNREFPMERDAVETLAAGAYDLEGHEVEAIVDRAIEKGEFAEDGRLLRRA